MYCSVITTEKYRSTSKLKISGNYGNVDKAKNLDLGQCFMCIVKHV